MKYEVKAIPKQYIDPNSIVSLGGSLHSVLITPNQVTDCIYYSDKGVVLGTQFERSSMTVSLSFVSARDVKDYEDIGSLLRSIGINSFRAYDPSPRVLDMLATFGYKEVSREAGKYLHVSDLVTYELDLKVTVIDGFFNEYLDQSAFDKDLDMQSAYNDYLYYLYMSDKISINEHNQLSLNIELDQEFTNYVRSRDSRQDSNSAKLPT